MHRGHIVEKFARLSGVSQSALAKELGVARSTLYNWYENADLPDAHIKKIGAIIGHDFSAEINTIEPATELMAPTISSQDAPTMNEVIRQRDEYVNLYKLSQLKVTQLYEDVIALQRENKKLSVENTKLKAKG